LGNLCLFGLCLLWLGLLLLHRLLGLLLLKLLPLLSLLFLLGCGQFLWLLWLLYGFDNWFSFCWLGSLLLWSWGWLDLLWCSLGLGLSCFLGGFSLGNGPFILICSRFLSSLLGGLLAAASPCLGIFLLCLIEPRVRVLCVLVPEMEDQHAQPVEGQAEEAHCVYWMPREEHLNGVAGVRGSLRLCAAA